MTEGWMKDRERYLAAAHAMQSGVAAEMADSERAAATSPKHLRVGVNTAMVDHASIVTLLVEKGILTWDEVHKALADGMEREVAAYEERLSAARGTTIKLA